MYKEYEQKMERMAHILKIVKKILIVLSVVVLLFLLFFFLVGFRYKAMQCDPVVYGETPKPKAFFTTFGEITYTYRPAGAEDAEWSSDVPVIAGEYEVRAQAVSAVGFKKEEIKKFRILPKELDIRLQDISIMGDPHTATVSEADYEISGLEYDDNVQDVNVKIEDGRDETELTYRLETLQIVHADGTDAADCYTIPKKSATIRDARIALTVMAGSQNLKYDGDLYSFLECDEWKIVSGSLKPGHTAEFHCKAYDAASYRPRHAVNRIVEGDIKDENGNSVMDQYKVELKDGELTLSSRSLILTSGSATKEYDGKALMNPEYTISGDGLAEGDVLEATVIGSIVDPGTVPNSFGVVAVRDAANSDVTEYYNITLKAGKLKVTSPPGDRPGGGKPGGSGTPGGNRPGGSGGPTIITADENGFEISRSGSEFSGDNSFNFGQKNTSPGTVFSFYGQSNRMYYFKEFSYGDYTGGGFLKTEGEEDYKRISDCLVGNILRHSYDSYRDIVRVSELAIDHPVSPYFLTMPVSLDENYGSYTCETYFTLDSYNFPSSYDSQEQEYRDFVYSTYLDVPQDVKEKLLELGEEAGLYAESGNLFEGIAYYIQNAAEYSFDWGEFPEDEDMVLQFLTVNKKGICQHYAAAATLMYRAYGIPARYVVGFVQQGRPGKWTSVTTNCGHAWTEIYMDGTGWVPVEVTGGSGSGNGNGMSPGDFEYQYEDDDEYYPDLIVAVDCFSKVYDGKKDTPLVLNGHLVSGRLRDGDKVVMPTVVVPDNEMYRNVIDAYYGFYDGEVYVLDSAGNDVSYLYNISIAGGWYSVSARPLSINIYGEYDESTDRWDMKHMHWSISKGSLAEGQTLEVYKTYSYPEYGFVYTLCEIGDYMICARITDENGENVTSNYDIESSILNSSSEY